jgi:hypothetical protein
MRLLCPFCQKAITVPDSESGKAVNCPECNQQFAAPLLTTPPPAPSAPPPPPLQPTQLAPAPVKETYVASEPEWSAQPAGLPNIPQPDREMSGFSRMISVPLDMKIIPWIPAGALLLIFVLTWFPWNGIFPGGYSAYTQNAWQGVLGWISLDDTADDEMKLSSDLKERVHSSLWLLPYLLLLFPTLALAIAGPILDVAKLKIPPNLEPYWKYRPLVLGALTLLMLLFLFAQWASGFGIQNAVSEKIEADAAEKKAQANTPDKRQRWEMHVSAMKGMFHVKTTPWMRLTVLLHLLATAAVAAEAGLALRGNKPPPRVGVMW